MKVVITPHAEEQIENRKLARERVIQIVSNPEEIISATSGRYFAQSKFVEGDKEYLLRVLFEDKDGERQVITVYPTSRVKKYWKGGNQ
jgi:hypothetical protein